MEIQITQSLMMLQAMKGKAFTQILGFIVSWLEATNKW